MQVKISAPGAVIAAKRGNGCESVTEAMPSVISGIVEGEYACIYENKLSHKLVINSNNQRFRVSGYDDVREGDTISCSKKSAEIGGKAVYWYTMDAIVEVPTKPEPPKNQGKGKGKGAPSF